MGLLFVFVPRGLLVWCHVDNSRVIKFSPRLAPRPLSPLPALRPQRGSFYVPSPARRGGGAGRGRAGRECGRFGGTEAGSLSVEAAKQARGGWLLLRSLSLPPSLLTPRRLALRRHDGCRAGWWHTRTRQRRRKG